MPRKIRVLSILATVMLFFTTFGASADSAEAEDDYETSGSSCTVKVGDGDDDDADVHAIFLPGQHIKIGEHYDSEYLPCGPRNFMANDGNYWHINNTRIGDRFVMIEAVTTSGVVFWISLSAYFSLNQDYNTLLATWQHGLKYGASSDVDGSNDENFSDLGWNGMLGETFGPALERAARRAALDMSDPMVDDSIWRLELPTQFDILATKISETYLFNALRFTTGFDRDLFCGSNTSGWTDPANPGNADGGSNTYNCTFIRIAIDDVKLAPDSRQSPAGLAIINADRLANARAIYGDDAEEVLAELAKINTCIDAGGNCVVVVGGEGSAAAAASVPTSTPDPTSMPTPTPTPEKK